MFELARIQPGDGHDQGCGGSGHHRIAVIGSDGLVADLIVVERNVKRPLDVGHRSACSHEEVVGTNLDYLQIVRLKEICDDFGLGSRRCKARCDLRPVKEVTIVGRIRIVEIAGQRVEVGLVVGIQPDADLDRLGGILRPEIFRGGDIARCVVSDELFAHRRAGTQACQGGNCESHQDRAAEPRDGVLPAVAHFVSPCLSYVRV